MAKKPDYTNLMAKTEGEAGSNTADNSDLDEGNIKPMGVGLKGGELEAINAIAAKHKMTRNSLLRYAVRWFIVQYRAGNVDLAGDVQTEVTEVTTVTLPGGKTKTTPRPR